MAILIKDPETDRLIRQLAARSGETLTNAVKQAVQQRLQRLPLTEAQIAERRRKLDAILAKFDAMPTVDHRTPDEILGYNEQGLFD